VTRVNRFYANGIQTTGNGNHGVTLHVS